MIELSVDAVVRLNEAIAGAGGGVRDRNGVSGALSRISGGAFGFDPYPTVWEKAAVLIQGLASTQYFLDGNKRTAYATAELFLSLNGHPLRDVPPVQAEAFVLAISRDLLHTEENPKRSIERGAEWFESVALRASDRLQVAMLSKASNTDEGTLQTDGAFLAYMQSNPNIVVLYVAMRLLWAPGDAGKVKRITLRGRGDRGTMFYFLPDQEVEVPYTDFDEFSQLARRDAFNFVSMPEYSGTAWHNGVAPTILVWPFGIHAPRSSENWLDVEIDGDVACSLPLVASDMIDGNIDLRMADLIQNIEAFVSKNGRTE